MAAITSTIIAAAGLATAGVGLVQGQKASKDAKAANASITQASIKAEALRAEQMRLDSFRRQRDIIRQSLIARSTAVSGATASGAQYSSGLAGGLAQIAGQATGGLLAQGQNEAIGEGLFSANRSRMNAEFSLSNARSDQQTASGLFALGSSMVNNSEKAGASIQSGRVAVGNLFSGVNS